MAASLHCFQERWPNNAPVISFKESLIQTFCWLVMRIIQTSAFLHYLLQFLCTKGNYAHINQPVTIFILKAAHAPVSAHTSYFEAINHKTINHLPRSDIFMKLSELAWKWPKLYFLGLILAANIERNKCPPEMTYLSVLGAYWNEYGNKLAVFVYRNGEYNMHSQSSMSFP